MATSIAIPVVRSVPTSSGITPKLGGSNSGVHLVPERNSQTPTSPKNSIVGTSSATTIPVVVRIDRNVAKIRIALTTSSP